MPRTAVRIASPAAGIVNIGLPRHSPTSGPPMIGPTRSAASGAAGSMNAALDARGSLTALTPPHASWTHAVAWEVPDLDGLGAWPAPGRR